MRSWSLRLSRPKGGPRDLCTEAWAHSGRNRPEVGIFVLRTALFWQQELPV